MYEAIQAILIAIGAVFIVKGIWNIAKSYHVDKILSMFIYKNPKYNEEKRK